MKPWELQIMLDWHAGDPVDDSERAINEEIFTDLQKNRNPYIDHPEWARRVFAASA
jgi:endonuclease I